MNRFPGNLFIPSFCGLLTLLIFSSAAQADKQCFSMAKTYYEQLYCEAKSQGYGQKLPGIYDFQRNNEMTQALLLKGPARQMGIDLKMPKATSETPPAGWLVPAPVTESADCLFKGVIVECGKRRFKFQANLSNSEIDKRALGEDNLMSMPVFTGSITNGSAVNDYLALAYAHYLDKMGAIGLAEATMAYGNFSYLFNDLNNKGVNFGKRFEKMYFYLKQDKQRMAVSSSIQPPVTLKVQDCFPLSHYWVCEQSRKNYLYRAVD